MTKVQCRLTSWLVAAAELISVAFGIAGVAIALATYLIARKRSSIPSNSFYIFKAYLILNSSFSPRWVKTDAYYLEPDAELALLNLASPPESAQPSLEGLDNSAITTNPAGAAPQQNNQLHEVIGDALELFSRHLRGRNW